MTGRARPGSALHADSERFLCSGVHLHRGGTSPRWLGLPLGLPSTKRRGCQRLLPPQVAVHLDDRVEELTRLACKIERRAALALSEATQIVKYDRGQASVCWIV